MAQHVINADALVDHLNTFTPCLREKDFIWMKFAVKKILSTTCDHFPFEGVLEIKDAFLLSADMHKMEYRDNDVTPYLLHLINVAYMLVSEGVLDLKTVLGAILHDTVELLSKLDNAGEKMKERLQQIQKKFGVAVRKIVDYLTKRHLEDKGAYWKRMLAIKEYSILWRVLTIKYADRIHNIQTLKDMKREDSKEKKVDETLKWFPIIKAKLEKVLRFLWNHMQIENRFYLRLPAKLDSLLQAALEPHLHLAKLHPV